MKKLFEKIRRNIWLVLILFGAGILLFASLGNHYLWLDEADTAVLARSILKTGLPYIWNGTNLMVGGGWGAGVEYNSNFLIRLHPWLQHYITSISFMMFGENTWAARAPFALLGWFTIFFLYLLTYRITLNKKVALLSTFLLTVSIPFVLYMRQCRYYGLLSCLSFPLIYSYYRMPEKKYSILFFLYALLLFFSHYLFMVTLWAGIAAYFFIFDFSLRKFKHFFFSTLAVFFLAALWFFYMDLWPMVNAYLVSGGRQAFSYSLIENVRTQMSFLINLNSAAVPLSLLALAPVLFFLKRGKMQSPRLYVMLLVIILINIILIPLAGMFPERYSVGLIPLFCVLMAMMCYEIFASRKIAGSLFILVFLSTNIFNEIPALCGKPVLSLMPAAKERLLNVLGPKKMYSIIKDIKEVLCGKRYYLDYLYEITHDYDGPMEGIVEFLNTNARRGDIVVTPFGQHSIAFYCDDKDIRLAKLVENKEKFLGYHPEWRSVLPDYIFDYADLDWFIPRKYWTGIGYTEEEILSYIKKRGWQWRRLEIPYPDIRWNNRPELRLHYFRTDRTEQNVVIYRVYK